MKENKKDILNLDETKELNTLSNDNICEIIEMAINDIKDLYDHMNNLQFEDDIENIEDDKEVRDSDHCFHESDHGGWYRNVRCLPSDGWRRGEICLCRRTGI